MQKCSSPHGASFGWTVVQRPGDPIGKPYVYKRDCPADKEHFSEDLAPFTHPTQKEALEAGLIGKMAYAKKDT